MVVGNPGRLKGWMSRHGHKLEFNSNGTSSCPESKFRYRFDGHGVPRCLDCDEEAALPAPLAVGKASYDEFKKV
jgi:UDP-2-acetamido-3-amino-2,3-dideoxy-glucuronate N-acetyltransferase